MTEKMWVQEQIEIEMRARMIDPFSHTHASSVCLVMCVSSFKQHIFFYVLGHLISTLFFGIQYTCVLQYCFIFVVAITPSILGLLV